MSATTSVDHERTHDESTNRSADKHRKNQGKLVAPKRGVFGGSTERAKMGERVVVRKRAWSKKIFERWAVW